ncbi:hypothetical protein FRC17_003645 [Serendipita sp. 399]|nr:hypothetical protein FRC17_003645 [Serendipita sp. 399]
MDQETLNQLREFFGPLNHETLVSAARALRIAKALTYAGFSIMIWDMMLTLPREVELIWKSRITAVKVIFLLNRYVSIPVLAGNAWLMSGNVEGLTSSLSSMVLIRHRSSSILRRPRLFRDFLSVSDNQTRYSIYTLTNFGIASLWAWYGLSTRVLRCLLAIWIATTLANLGLTANVMWVRKHDLIHNPIFNGCVTVTPGLWKQWLPAVLEHGFYFSFLVYNAIGTPRSSQRPALAILYRDGIIFYVITFSVFLTSLLVWRFASRIYMGLTLVAPWVVVQMAISRLLLDVKTSQLFDRKEKQQQWAASFSLNAGCVAPHRPDIPEERMHPPSSGMLVSREDGMNETIRQDLTSEAPHRVVDAERYRDGMARLANGIDDDGDGEEGSLEGRWNEIQQRLWWILLPLKTRIGSSLHQPLSPNHQHSRSRHIKGGGEIHVDVYHMQDEEEEAHGGTQERRVQLGGIRETRLGRYDGWL